MVAGGGIRTDQTIVTNARHYAALRAADGALEDVLTGLDTGITGDFVAQDIRRALAFLGEITGEIGVEDLLGEIFGKFCIGK
jgi:tRNA modification GTPase